MRSKTQLSISLFQSTHLLMSTWATRSRTAQPALTAMHCLYGSPLIQRPAPLSGTPGNNDVGSFDIQITATDAANASAATVFAIAVANVNDAPRLNHPTPDQLATVGAPFVLQFQVDTFSD